MIRINLIQPPPSEVEAKAKLQEPSALLQRKEFMPIVSLVVCFGIVGLLYWSANRHIDQLNQQLVIEQQEAARLAGVQAQNRKLEVQLNEIKQHLAVIETLQANRTGPQRLMTLLGDAVNRVNGLYLLSVSTEKGRLTIHGQSDHMNGVADFITALQSIPAFADVQLRQIFEDDQKNGAVSFKFDLDCEYQPVPEAPRASAVVIPASAPARLPGR